ncbi:MAG: hypothetical protein KY391_07030 [Actinobacteria bacterium]|nr:hypothetical protein [Actinomycetota bacterium]
MGDREAPKRRLPRWVGIVAVTVGVVAWTVFLIDQEANGTGGFFSALVRIMGSVGLLLALFFVVKPRHAGVLDMGAVRDGDAAAGVDHLPHEQPSNKARWAFITITIALAFGGVAYRFAQDTELHQTSAFFIGVPAVMAIALALTPKAKSATGMIVKGLTLALLLSGVLLGEGFVCILMASPLFYLVGVAIGVPIDHARKKKKSETPVYSVVGLAMLLMSLEGMTPATTLVERETIQVTKRIDATPGEIADALASPPRFDQALPLYLRLGFPRPVRAYGSGLEVGDRRTIVFGTESPMRPMAGEGHDHVQRAAGTGGELVLQVVARGRGRVVFEAVHDSTAFTHWIEWRRSIVEWRAVGDGETTVTWTLTFERKLSPSWYFGPWQRYAGRLAAGFLIDTAVTP